MTEPTTTWPTVRAAIMELRSRSLKIDTAIKQVISELGLSRRRRGCRAGRHERRGRPKFSACLSHSTCCNDVTTGIPVVTGYRPKCKHNTVEFGILYHGHRDARSAAVTDCTHDGTSSCDISTSRMYHVCLQLTFVALLLLKSMNCQPYCRKITLI